MSRRVFAIGRAILWQNLLNYLNSSSENAVFVVPECVNNQNLEQMSTEIRFQKEDMKYMPITHSGKQLIKKSTKQSTKQSKKRLAKQRIQPTRKSKQVKRNMITEWKDDNGCNDESSWSEPD